MTNTKRNAALLAASAAVLTLVTPLTATAKPAPLDWTSCGGSDLALSKLRPWPAPDGTLTENLATARRVADTCARDGGTLVQHLTTANEARDLDRVRAALGERKVSAWGVSYGSYVGAVYNELFPHRTDRLVLDSTGDPDPVRVGRAWLAGFEAGVEDVFPEFATWASRPGNPDRLARTAAEVRPLFLALAARLDRAPVPWPGANPEELNGNVLRQTMLDAFYDPDEGSPPSPGCSGPPGRAPCRPPRRPRPRGRCGTPSRSAPAPCATTSPGPPHRPCTRRRSPSAAPSTR